MIDPVINGFKLEEARFSIGKTCFYYETLAQVPRGAVSAPFPEVFVGCWGFEQPVLVECAPAHGRGVGMGDFPSQTILCFCGNSTGSPHSQTELGLFLTGVASWDRAGLTGSQSSDDLRASRSF